MKTTITTKQKLLFAGVVGLIILTIIATSVHQIKSPGMKIPGTSSSLTTPPSMAVKAIQTGSGWGYEVWVDGQRFIVQDQIPGVPGKHSFASQQEALRCGELVVKKIKARKNPTISPSELDSLNIVWRIPNE